MGLRRRLMILNPDQMQSLGPGGCRDGPSTKSESQEKERDQKQPVRTCSRSAPSSPRSKPKPIFRFHTPYNRWFEPCVQESLKDT
ncbi:uncharacterized protein LAJ45_06098 [Morchella importuna]|uniref:uncharacterized protein n=1 Tax=Morchella importuna TaxID=1174673 RepID=UPI001E8E2BA9|nr:uncharacterized protein LAJ45_06098 [Morchella importuna]KAH8149945.1 hypothetical protein LAJ45_06098 [Morchella importuna]